MERISSFHKYIPGFDWNTNRSKLIPFVCITKIYNNLLKRSEQKELWKPKTRFRDIPLDPGTVSMCRRKQDKLTTTRGDGRSVNGASESYDVITPTTTHGLRVMSSHAAIATNQVKYQLVCEQPKYVSII